MQGSPIWIHIYFRPLGREIFKVSSGYRWWPHLDSRPAQSIEMGCLCLDV